MNQLDVSGILQSYAEKARRAASTIQLKEIVRDVKQELDLRKIHMDKPNA